MHLGALVLVAAAFAASWALAFLPRRDALFYSTDGAFYEGVARGVRFHRRLPRVNEAYLLDVQAATPNEHPLLLAVLLSLLPDGGRLWLQRHGGGVLLGVLAAAAATSPATDGRHSVAFAAAALVIGTPILVRESVGFNPRILGVLLVTASWAAYASLRPRHAVLALGAGVIIVALVALTHRFALQAACVTAVSLAVAEQDLVPLLAFAAGVGLALATTDHYRTVLCAHLGVLAQHRRARNLNERAYAAYAGGAEAATKPEWWRAARLVGAGGAALFLVPWLASSSRPHNAAWGVAVGLWAVSVLVALVPALRFAGEGERYMEFVAVPAAVSLGAGPVSPVALVLLAAGVAVAVLQYRKLWRTARDERTPALRPSLLAALERVKEEPEGRILALPMWMGDFVVCTAAKQVFDARSHGTWRALPQYVPVLRAPVADAVGAFALEAAFVDTRIPVPQLDEIEAVGELGWEEGPYRYYRFR